jgi:hypothetical protein
MSRKDKGDPQSKAEVAELLARINELPDEQQRIVLSELQGQELRRLGAGAEELLHQVATGTDELLSSLSTTADLSSAAQIRMIDLPEAAKFLLAAIDRRLDAGKRIKDFVASVGPAQLTKEKRRDWRRLAKADSDAERHLRTCREIYGRVLRAGA